MHTVNGSGTDDLCCRGGEFRADGVRVAASRLEGDTPLLSWWRRGGTAVGPWTLELTRRMPGAATGATLDGWGPRRAHSQPVAGNLG